MERVAGQHTQEPWLRAERPRAWRL
uniref:Uncharacterized protein n=1 Tax=Arundo donax TaxID=35708 RepID=A0A0A9AQC3_ARUDO